jgi:hypothetical protein
VKRKDVAMHQDFPPNYNLKHREIITQRCGT